MNDKKLFIVEYKDPSKYGEEQIYVIARDYNEAANKAMLYLDNKSNKEEMENLFDEDGSLKKKQKKQEIRIEGIKIANDVIW